MMKNGMFLGGSEDALGSGIEFNPNIPSEECFTTPMRGLAEGTVGVTVQLVKDGKVVDIDIEQALVMSKPFPMDRYAVLEAVTTNTML
jgi:leucyl aminopeptidase (aminopeptidase T)